MGDIINAKCNCGFESGGIFAGGGMTNYDKFCSVPALCENCRDLVIVNYLRKNLKCPKCGKKVVVYGDPTLQQTRKKAERSSDIFSWFVDEKKGTFALPDVFYLCPRCGKKRMRFFHNGQWD